VDRNLQKRLLKKLKKINHEQLTGFNVVLLPDFFVDHFLTLNMFDDNIDKIKKIYQQGGGNLPNVSQKISQGGNSANTALALARLGIGSHLICKTDELGLHLLEYFLGRAGVDLSGVKTDGRLAITTALEFDENHTNVMIGDTGSVSDFSFEDLDENDLAMISKSDLLCVTTWNLNNNGTMLAKKAFEFAKKNGIKTFFDTGDPSPKKDEISDLIENVLVDENLDIFGLNENELLHCSSVDINSNEELVNAAVSLKKKIHARIDLHTADFTCTINENAIVVPTLELSMIYRSTGAGDAWNAGNIFAELLNFSDDERLLFASCVAGCYISSIKPVHPTLNDIIKFLSSLGKI